MLAELTTILAEQSFNIVQIAVYRQTEKVIIIIQVVEKNASGLKQVLTENNYDVMMCQETKRS